MFLEHRDDQPRWRCNGKIINLVTKEKCCLGTSLSVRTDSFFANRRLQEQDVMLILWNWCHRVRKTTIAEMVGCSVKSVSAVLNDWYQMLQEDISLNDCRIGGIDSNGQRIIVEIDESKFGKRKYNRGGRVEGVWVVGGVERTAERKCFLVTVNDRSTETMNAIIEKYVLEGSIVHTDCWRAYNDMVNLDQDLVHRTVNHSVSFIQNGVHTNTIEGEQNNFNMKHTNCYLGTWSGIKINVSPALRTKKMMPWKLLEFIWRRKNVADIWGGVLRTLREVEFSKADTNPPWYTQIADDEEY